MSVPNGDSPDAFLEAVPVAVLVPGEGRPVPAAMQDARRAVSAFVHLESQGRKQLRHGDASSYFSRCYRNHLLSAEWHGSLLVRYSGLSWNDVAHPEPFTLLINMKNADADSRPEWDVVESRFTQTCL